jgi:hypothetical protein
MLGGSRWAIPTHGTEWKILGMVADDPELLGAELILTYEKRWPIEVARSTTSLSRGYTLKYLIDDLFPPLSARDIPTAAIPPELSP